MHSHCVNFDVFYIRALHDTKQYIKNQQAKNKNNKENEFQL